MKVTFKTKTPQDEDHDIMPFWQKRGSRLTLPTLSPVNLRDTHLTTPREVRKIKTMLVQ